MSYTGLTRTLYVFFFFLLFLFFYLSDVDCPVAVSEAAEK
jgi:hypothetical protein